MKTLMFFSALLICTLSSSASLAKQCEGVLPQADCKVEIFCVEVEPFLIPIQVEIWQQSERLTLHKFAVRSDDTRAEIASVPVLSSILGQEIFYRSHGFQMLELAANLANGASNFSEKVFGRTVITPMFCLPQN